MKKLYAQLTLLSFVLSVAAQAQNIVGGRMNEVFSRTIISPAGGLINPWEITYGPDDSLWITEAKGYRVYKMSPAGGTKRMILDLSLKSTFLGNTPLSDSVFNMQFTYSLNNPQGGLAGMAIHPQFNNGTTHKFVYISYVRDSIRRASDSTGIFFRNRVVRFTYNTVTGRLGNPVSLCDTLPGSSDHNSQRMIIAPVNGVDYLFYAQGDMGAGQLINTYRVNRAQDSASYEGKILRFNLEADADAGTLDKWIPNDNPYNYAAQSAVWCMGIRNNQGLAYDSVRDILYGSSHGPYSDDEVNIIERKRNYGHPRIIGYAADHNYDGSSAGAYKSGAALGSLSSIGSETDEATLIGSSYKDPLFSGYPTTQAQISTIWTTQPGNSTWPSEGWSGLGLYNYSTIPGWKNSLLMAGLKWGRVIRTKLDNAGTAIVPTNGKDTVTYFNGTPRYRDMAFGGNGNDIYLIMDNGNSSAGPAAKNALLTQCFGCVQKFTFLGYNNVSGTSAIPTSIPIAAGKPNTCEDANTITITAANTNYWVPITDTNSNIIAEIKANGNLLGTVTTSMFANSGAVREQVYNNTLYLDRNITITPQVQPSSAVSIRLYLTTTEFDALKNANNSMGQPSNVNNITDISIFKNSDACGVGLTSASAVITTNQSAFANGYVVQGDISSFSTFYLAAVTSLLPIHALSFKGTLVNNISQLHWTTEDEKGTKLFTVERSINSRDFYPLGNLLASNAQGLAYYNFSDSALGQLSSPVIYYRLRLTDADGKFSYSDVITLKATASKANVNVHPNPVVNEFTVNINAAVAEKANWQITDLAGKPVMQHSMSLTKGANEMKINISRLPAGIYYLRVTGTNINQSVKLSKQ